MVFLTRWFGVTESDTDRDPAREKADIELIVDMPADGVIAEVDPRRVERILRNLIANAIDHAEHKPVRIRMAADDNGLQRTFCRWLIVGQRGQRQAEHRCAAHCYAANQTSSRY